MNATQMIETLRTKFDGIKSIDPCLPTYGDLCKFLDQQDDKMLTLLAGAGIKWVSSLAMNRCLKRGIA
jgi:hypothetical protein